MNRFILASVVAFLVAGLSSSVAGARHLCKTDECPPTVLAGGLSAPDSLALRGQNLYWSEQDSVSTVPKAGGAVTVIATGQTNISGITSDGSFTYWTTAGPNVFDPALDGIVARVNNNGTGFFNISEGGDMDPFDPSVGGGFMYFADFTANRIRRMNLATRGLSTFATGEVGAMATAADDTNVVWIDYLTNLIRIASHTGTPTTLAIDPNTSGSTPYAIALTASSVVWVSNNVPGSPGFLYSVPRAGGPITTLGEDPTGSAVAVACDAVSCYWVTEDVATGRVLRTPQVGGSTTILTTQFEPFAIAVDPGSVGNVYFSNVGFTSGDGQVLSMTKTAP